MKFIHAFIILSLCTFNLNVKAKNGISLDEAVNQAKSEGRVLSAKTINGRHEVKVLTRNGTVKTINKQAIKGNKNAKQNPNHSNRNPRSPEVRRSYEPSSDLKYGSDNDRKRLKSKDPDDNNFRSDRGDTYSQNRPSRPSFNRNSSQRSLPSRNTSNSNRSNRIGSEQNRPNQNRSQTSNNRSHRDDGNNSRNKNY